MAGLFFLVVLCGAICAKGTLLFIASHVRQDINFVCNINNDTSINYCFREPINNNIKNDNDSLQTTISALWKYIPETPKTQNGVWSHYDTNGNVTGLLSYYETPYEITQDDYELVAGKNGTVFVRVRMCEEITMRWAWCLLLVMTTPAIFGWVRCFWRMCFKKTKSPVVSTIGFVSHILEFANQMH